MTDKTACKFTEQTSEERWHHRWRHLAAYVFLVITMFDFVIMPVMYEIINERINEREVVEMALKFKDTVMQQSIITEFANKRTWNPLTLLGGGTFYMAFGAILGAAAWTRGQEKIEKTRRR